MAERAEVRVAAKWDADPRNGVMIISWSDFGTAAAKDGIEADDAITWTAFRRYRRGATVRLKPGHTWLDADGISGE